MMQDKTVFVTVFLRLQGFSSRTMEKQMKS